MKELLERVVDHFDNVDQEDMIKLVEIVKLQARALKHYANDKMYHRSLEGQFPIIIDNGTTASFALERAKEIARGDK